MKELLLEEIDSLSQEELLQAINYVRIMKSNRISDLSEIPRTPKPPHRPGSGKSILRHVGKWVGDDLKECLEIVKSTRGLAKF